MKKTTDLTNGNIKQHLKKLTIPMIFGILGLVIFNLVDTYFIGLLGTDELAAVTFTFPMVLTLNSITLGMSMGVTAYVSRVVGSNDQSILKQVVFDSIFMAVIVAVFFVCVGFIVMDSVIAAMGAPPNIAPLVKTYMTIWLLGNPFVVFPMVGNGVIRSLGDTRTPSVVMIIAGTVNAILDPMFIFGIGFFPELGIAGAALATVIGRFITFSVSLYVLVKREQVLVIQRRKLRDMLHNWLIIWKVGLPDAISRSIIPLGTGVITALIAGYGADAVAGYGIAVKIEGFLLLIISALASILVPFGGQNIGANKFNRLSTAVKYAEKFSVLLHIGMYVLLIFVGRYLAAIFTNDTAVIEYTSRYLMIVPLAYTFKGIILSDVSVLNVMRHPVDAALINLIQMFGLFIPLAYLGASLLGIDGIFIALALSLIIAGILAMIRMRYRIRRYEFSQ